MIVSLNLQRKSAVLFSFFSFSSSFLFLFSSFCLFFCSYFSFFWSSRATLDVSFCFFLSAAAADISSLVLFLFLEITGGEQLDVLADCTEHADVVGHLMSGAANAVDAAEGEAISREAELGGSLASLLVQSVKSMEDIDDEGLGCGLTDVPTAAAVGVLAGLDIESSVCLDTPWAVGRGGTPSPCNGGTGAGSLTRLRGLKGRRRAGATDGCI